ELDRLVRDARRCYETYQFRRLHEMLFNFCNDTLSAVYLAATKDRLYCDAPDSERRRRTQAAMHRIASALIRLLAPVIPHTADEAWLALHPDLPGDASVHLSALPDVADQDVHPDWAYVMDQRDA